MHILCGHRCIAPPSCPSAMTLGFDCRTSSNKEEINAREKIAENICRRRKVPFCSKRRIPQIRPSAVMMTNCNDSLPVGYSGDAILPHLSSLASALCLCGPGGLLQHALTQLNPSSLMLVPQYGVSADRLQEDHQTKNDSLTFLKRHTPLCKPHLLQQCKRKITPHTNTLQYTLSCL